MVEFIKAPADVIDCIDAHADRASFLNVSRGILDLAPVDRRSLSDEVSDGVFERVEQELAVQVGVLNFDACKLGRKAACFVAGYCGILDEQGSNDVFYEITDEQVLDAVIRFALLEDVLMGRYQRPVVAPLDKVKQANMSVFRDKKHVIF